MSKPAYLQEMERAAEQVLWKLLAELDADTTSIRVDVEDDSDIYTIKTEGENE